MTQQNNVWPATSARVDFKISNDATWTDAIQFGLLSDGTAWSFPAGVTFLMDVKLNRYDASPRLQLSTSNGRIVTDDPVQRVIHFLVTPADIQANLPVGEYVYDFIMFDNTFNPPVRTQLMHGLIKVGQGPTYP